MSIEAPGKGSAAADPVAEIHFPAHDDWLGAEELAGLDARVLRERMEALAPEVAARARETELARRPLDDLWAKFRASGVFYHFVPKRYGGLELGLEDLVDVTMPINEACCSTGWVVTFCIEHLYIFSQFKVAAQDEIYADHPYIIAPGVAGPPGIATPVEGGYRLTGRWKFASGIMNADWVMAMAMVAGTGEGGPPEMIFAVFPAEEVTVHDVWHMSGMCGTGSNDFSTDDVFLPAHRAMPASWFFNSDGEGARSFDNPIYRVPLTAFTSMTTLLPALGGARAAVRIYGERLQEKLVIGTQELQMDRATRQVRLAEADMLVAEAELLVRDSCRSMTRQVTEGDPLDDVWRRRMRAQNQRAINLCSQAVQLAVTGAGAGAQALHDPLQRIQRDVNTMLPHALYDYEMAYELQGRALLGLPPNHMMF